MRNWIILLSMLFLSCETAVNPNLPDDGSGMVVYSFFRPDAPIQLDVFQTVSILDKESIRRVTGLYIDLYENEELVETIEPNAFGSYVGTLKPKQGHTYRFNTLASSATLSAESIIPSAVNISAAKISETIEDFNLDEYGYPAQITFTDPAGEANYYAVEVFVERCDEDCDETAISGELNELLVEDVKVNTSGNVDINIGMGPEGIDGFRYLYLNDNGFDGQRFTFDFYIVPTILDFERPQNVAIKFVLKSITEEYYNYLITSDFQKQIEEEGTLAEPVQISTNIENGLGVFAGYNYSVYSVRITR